MCDLPRLDLKVGYPGCGRINFCNVCSEERLMEATPAWRYAYLQAGGARGDGQEYIASEIWHGRYPRICNQVPWSVAVSHY